MDFYNRGGDFRSDETEIDPLELTEGEKSALVAFLLALTDDRVRYEKEPFDHPSIRIPNGPNIPQVGARGRGLQGPIRPFLWTGDPQFHFKANP